MRLKIFRFRVPGVCAQQPRPRPRAHQLRDPEVDCGGAAAPQESSYPGPAAGTGRAAQAGPGQCYRWRTLINISRSKKTKMLLKCVEVSEIFTIYIFLFQFRRFLHSSGLSQLDFLYRVEQVR